MQPVYIPLVGVLGLRGNLFGNHETDNYRRLFIYKIIGQNYSISVFGFHACDVIQTISSSDKIEFRTQNRGLFDIIWPANNYYEATFNTRDFSLKKLNKKINQGDYKT